MVDVAQLAERLVVVQVVAGSSPVVHPSITVGVVALGPAPNLDTIQPGA